MSNDYLDNFDPDLNYYSSTDEQNYNQSNYYHIDQFNDLIKTNTNCLNLLCCNIRSFNSNSSMFMALIENYPQFIVLTETWFKPNYCSDIENYNAFHVTRPNRRSGGVSVFIRNDFHAKKIEAYCYVNTHIEICTVELELPNEFFFLFSIYRPHEGNVNDFLSIIDRTLSDNLFRKHKCILSGDFNINMLDSGPMISNLIDCMQSYHMLPYISQPTRFAPDDRCEPSLIDMFWANTFEIVNAGIVNYDLTDHCPIFLQIPCTVNSSNYCDEKVKIYFRLNNESNRESFSRVIAEHDWNNELIGNIDDIFSKFNDVANKLYVDCFPLMSKHVPIRNLMKPWFTPELKTLVKNKSSYFELYRLNIISKSENNRYKNKVKPFIDKATWRNLNSLMGRDKHKYF